MRPSGSWLPVSAYCQVPRRHLPWWEFWELGASGSSHVWKCGRGFLCLRWLRPRDLGFSGLVRSVTLSDRSCWTVGRRMDMLWMSVPRMWTDHFIPWATQYPIQRPTPSYE